MTISASPQLGAKVLIPYIYAKSNISVARNSTNTSGTGGVDDDEEVTHATVTIPGGLLVGSTSIFIYAFFRSTSSVSTKTFGLRVGGTSYGTISATTNAGNQLALFLHADNASNDQKAVNNAAGAFQGAGSIFDGSKDFSQDIDFTFTSRWGAAVASETITLESYLIWVFPGQ